MISVYLEEVRDALYPRRNGVLTKREKTVEAWESGHNEPSGPALRLMNMIQRYPDVLVDSHIFYITR